MVDPFVAEIRIFASNFAPTGWAYCNGQLMPIAPNTALFSLLGTTYGGDGETTFALPDLQGRAPMFHGQGAGLSPRTIGEMGGAPSIALLQSEMPSHTHAIQASDSAGNQVGPTGNAWARAGAADGQQMYAASANTNMSPLALSVTGQGPHNNMPPYLVLNFVIALQGVFPPRPD
jgi:microcystin-dependent protein